MRPDNTNSNDIPTHPQNPILSHSTTSTSTNIEIKNPTNSDELPVINITIIKNYYSSPLCPSSPSAEVTEESRNPVRQTTTTANAPVPAPPAGRCPNSSTSRENPTIICDSSNGVPNPSPSTQRSSTENENRQRNHVSNITDTLRRLANSSAATNDQSNHSINPVSISSKQSTTSNRLGGETQRQQLPAATATVDSTFSSVFNLAKSKGIPTIIFESHPELLQEYKFKMWQVSESMKVLSEMERPEDLDSEKYKRRLVQIGKQIEILMDVWEDENGASGHILAHRLWHYAAIQTGIDFNILKDHFKAIVPWTKAVGNGKRPHKRKRKFTDMDSGERETSIATQSHPNPIGARRRPQNLMTITIEPPFIPPLLPPPPTFHPPDFQEAHHQQIPTFNTPHPNSYSEASLRPRLRLDVPGFSCPLTVRPTRPTVFSDVPNVSSQYTDMRKNMRIRSDHQNQSPATSEAMIVVNCSNPLDSDRQNIPETSVNMQADRGPFLQSEDLDNLHVSRQRQVESASQARSSENLQQRTSIMSQLPIQSLERIRAAFREELSLLSRVDDQKRAKLDEKTKKTMKAQRSSEIDSSRVPHPPQVVDPCPSKNTTPASTKIKVETPEDGESDPLRTHLEQQRLKDSPNIAEFEGIEHSDAVDESLSASSALILESRNESSIKIEPSD